MPGILLSCLLDLKYFSKNRAIDEDMSLPLIKESSFLALKLIHCNFWLRLSFLFFENFCQFISLCKNKHFTGVSVAATSLCR